MPKPQPIKSAEFVRAVTHVEQAPPERPSVVFAGRSNVGKSSLLNRLVNRKALARTSGTPGRTREIVFFDIEGAAWFVDLPGYGYAKVSKSTQYRWAPMMERYLRLGQGIRLVVVILDVRREPTDEDRQMIEWLEDNERPYIFAVTKCDKLSRSQQAKRLAALRKALGLADDSALIPVSATTGQGIEDLLGVVRTVLG